MYSYDFSCLGQSEFSWFLACGEGEYGVTDIGNKFVTMLHGVMWGCLSIPGHIHCSCSTAIGIPVSEFVSFALSTIPTCPFLIQRIFHLLGRA